MKQTRRVPVRLLALLLVGSILPACGDTSGGPPAASSGGRSFEPTPLADTQPPAVAVSVAQHVLSPANGKLVDVGLKVVATDDSGQVSDLTVRVFCSEPAQADALPASLFRLNALPLLLRSTRPGSSSGRVYLIVARARDAAGNLGFAGATVVVPRNGSPGSLQAVETLAAQALAILTPNGSGFTPFPAGTFINNAPVALNDSYSTTGDPIVIGAPGVLGNDSDPDLDPLAALPLTRPAHGILIVQPDGSFTYTPDPGFSGTDSFVYVASDAWTSSSPVTVTLTVQSIQLPTTIDFTASPAPSVSGQQVTLTAVVSAVGSPVIPTGMVRFSFSDPSTGTTTVLGLVALDAAGVATLQVNILPVGILTLNADYLGVPGFFDPISITRIHVVNPGS